MELSTETSCGWLKVTLYHDGDDVGFNITLNDEDFVNIDAHRFNSHIKQIKVSTYSNDMRNHTIFSKGE